MSGQRGLTVDLWDVGQGDCTVITLPDGSLVIIDVGNKGSPVVEWLADRRPQPKIAAIVLTHNDSDHAGALPSILDNHASKIGVIWILEDRPRKDEPFAKIFRRAYEEEKKSGLKIRRLEEGSEIWRDHETGLVLRPIYPGFSENIRSSNPNNASGLVILEEGKTIHGAWPGDLPMGTVAEKLEDRTPRLLVGPHHGGPTDFKKKRRDGRELFRQSVEKVSPGVAYISVGTKNPYSHPRPGYLELLARHGCHVMCSQITTACDRKHLISDVPVFDGSGALGLRSPRTGTPCRGALRLTFINGALVPDEFTQTHMDRVSNLRRPQCLKGRGWKQGNPIPIVES